MFVAFSKIIYQNNIFMYTYIWSHYHWDTKGLKTEMVCTASVSNKNCLFTITQNNTEMRLFTIAF